jgi:hypothetical protein
MIAVPSVAAPFWCRFCPTVSRLVYPRRAFSILKYLADWVSMSLFFVIGIWVLGSSGQELRGQTSSAPHLTSYHFSSSITTSYFFPSAVKVSA